MGVKGINKKSHQNIIEALDKLEEVQRKIGLNSDSQQIAFFKDELNHILERYETIIQDLIEQVKAYDSLAMQIKLQFVNRKIRSLKNLVPEGTDSYSKIRECISLINSY